MKTEKKRIMRILHKAAGAWFSPAEGEDHAGKVFIKIYNDLHKRDVQRFQALGLHDGKIYTFDSLTECHHVSWPGER